MIVLEDKSREVKSQDSKSTLRRPKLWASTTNRRSTSKALVDKLKPLAGREDEYYSKPVFYGTKIKGLEQTLRTSKSRAKFRQEGRAKADLRKEERKREQEREKRRRELRRLKGQQENDRACTEESSVGHIDDAEDIDH
ncbi:hypothetical protein UCRPA7_2316 [Phaeoacremonium minimum UCRPA7]|uniref:Uncharacterized protein n=1 Tax=Phaeoacremonium minimum (strain UCR-PA7) TaxID=1286976 RepID=R8BS47_PHAM7|nr:hypothetical protein UCRPA7_2316 [Phaeoacremonium minimum UCRPA7]EOO02198.1 hypothetical protein UCRPA7_2316 [Phaeoacremonium minimum UCRPA7]